MDTFTLEWRLVLYVSLYGVNSINCRYCKFALANGFLLNPLRKGQQWIFSAHWHWVLEVDLKIYNRYNYDNFLYSLRYTPAPRDF